MSVCRITLLFLCALQSARALAASLPNDVKLKIDEDNPALADINATYNLPAGDYCIYWPLNAPERIQDHLPIKGLDLWYQRTAKTHIMSGRMDLRGTSENFKFKEEDHPFHFTSFIKTDNQPLILNFESLLPRQAFFYPNEIIYQDYLPLIDKECHAEHQPSIKHKVKIAITAPKPWFVLSPFANTKGHARTITLDGFHGDFVLGLDYKIATLRSETLDIQLFYRTDEYRKLLPIIQKTLSFYAKQLGPLPLKRLIIFESDHSTQANIPGLLAYLRPRQEFLKSLQEYWLNWSEWAMTAALAYQWFGGFLIPNHQNDSWLLHSLRDYYLLKALQQDANASNLFNSYNQSLFNFKFTYAEFQDLTGFSLISTTPKARLAHDNLDTYIRLRHQNPLLFIRNVFMLRSLEAVIGFQKLNAAIANIFPANRDFKTLAPREFANELLSQIKKSNPSMAVMANHILREWWTKAGWPDRELSDFKVSHNKQNEYLVSVEIAESGQLTIPSDIVVWDKRGKKHVIPAASQSLGKSQFRIAISEPIDRIVLDPHKLVFDHNRFNNSSKWSEVYFFPGGARELYQDAYTVFWFPYLIKRPGEDLRFGLQSSVLKYLRGDTMLSFETDNKGRNTTIDFSSEEETSIPGMDYLISAQKDFYNLRQLGARLNFKDVNSSTLHPVNLYLQARAKQEAADQDTLHGTLAMGINLLPGWRPEPCNFTLLAEHEQTPSKQGEGDIHYERSHATLSGICNITEKLQLRGRIFRGVTKTLINAPRNSFFWPNNLSEAKIRIDYPPEEPHEWIQSIGSELLLPLYFPFDIGSYVLTQKIRVRLFYDYGEASHATYYRSGGIGLIMPIGGDVSGAGSLSITRISLLSAVYQSVNDQKYEPSFLFDITGEL